MAKARGMGENAVRQLIVERTERRTLGLLGEDRVNVVQLNLDLDRASR